MHGLGYLAVGQALDIGEMNRGSLCLGQGIRKTQQLIDENVSFRSSHPVEDQDAIGIDKPLSRANSACAHLVEPDRSHYREQPEVETRSGTELRRPLQRAHERRLD